MNSHTFTHTLLVSWMFYHNNKWEEKQHLCCLGKNNFNASPYQIHFLPALHHIVFMVRGAEKPA